MAARRRWCAGAHCRASRRGRCTSSATRKRRARRHESPQTMKRFAALLDRLVLTPQRNVKLRLMTDYFRETPDPDRGYALATLTGDLAIASVKPAMLRDLMIERLDEVLFAYSYDYVGDLAETIALAWPPKPARGSADGAS